MAAYELLYDGNSAAAAAMRSAARQLDELSRFDARFQDSAAALDSARITVEDLGVTLRDYADSINASPERLAEIEDRLAQLDRLKRKYGQNLDEVIAYGGEVSQKLNEVENRDELLVGFHRELAAAGEKYLDRARALSRQRTQAARKLEKLVEAEIQDLAIRGQFRIEISGSDEDANWTGDGFDSVAYLISTNAGEPLRPVEQIASGGELSRVMLALKVCVMQPTSAPKNGVMRTLVFDEIDTGIGGRAAEAVGKKLKALARRHQVLCITHLPQIASFADHHYRIEKREVGGRARTNIRRLDAEDRREEIARMLSGARLNDTSRKHAEQLLKGNA
jgi:DNA repair protein RecN (Recombination protein N)